VKYCGQLLTFPFGLVGAYHLSNTGPFQLRAGAMGKWTGDSEFLLDLNFIANINHYTLDIKFHGDQIDVIVNEASGIVCAVAGHRGDGPRGRHLSNNVVVDMDRDSLRAGPVA
jgi:hypothetical protein